MTDTHTDTQNNYCNLLRTRALMRNYGGLVCTMRYFTYHISFAEMLNHQQLPRLEESHPTYSNDCISPEQHSY